MTAPAWVPFFSCFFACATFSFTSPTAASEDSGQRALNLTLGWCDPHDLFRSGWMRVGQELGRTFEELDVAVSWRKGALAKDVTNSAERRIQVVLVRSEPSEWRLPPNAMGAVLSRSGPQTEVYVFFPSVARVLGYRPEVLKERWPTTREERDLSRAFARVIAHEILHAVLPSRPHAGDGLTRLVLDRETLLASRVAIDSSLGEELRSALLRQTSGSRVHAAQGN